MVPGLEVAQELEWERDLVQAVALGTAAVADLELVTHHRCSHTISVLGNIRNLGLPMGRLNRLGSMNFLRNRCHLRKAQDLQWNMWKVCPSQ